MSAAAGDPVAASEGEAVVAEALRSGRGDLLDAVERLATRCALINDASSRVIHDVADAAIAWRALDRAVRAAEGRRGDRLAELEAGLALLDRELREAERRLDLA